MTKGSFTSSSQYKIMSTTVKKHIINYLLSMDNWIVKASYENLTNLLKEVFVNFHLHAMAEPIAEYPENNLTKYLNKSHYTILFLPFWAHCCKLLVMLSENKKMGNPIHFKRVNLLIHISSDNFQGQ